jgi:hypothetical protein
LTGEYPKVLERHCGRIRKVLVQFPRTVTARLLEVAQVDGIQVHLGKHELAIALIDSAREFVIFTDFALQK